MKKTLIAVASFALLSQLAACGPSPNDPNVDPSASPSASAQPSASPSAMPSADPSAMPSASPSAQPTAVPVDPATEITISTATASKNANFSYNFVVSGTGLGTLDGYEFLQIKTGPSTVPLVVNGQSKVDGVQVRALEITGTAINFTWLPDNGAPTNGDQLEVSFVRKGGDGRRESTTVRLTVN
jgi:hypothetical protein